MRIKVSEKQFDIAIKNLESMDADIGSNIQKNIKNSYQISEIKLKIIQIYKAMNWKVRSGYKWLKMHKK
jgi:hypothetical protein